MNMREILKAYLYQHRLICGALLLFVLVFACVFSLYDLQLEAILYSTLICAVLGLFMLALHFIRFYKSHRARVHVLSNLPLGTDALPEAKTLADRDYQEMVLKQCKIISDNETSFQRARQESIDYYTTWVHQIKTPMAVMQMTLQSEDSEEHRALLAELFRIEQYVDMVLCYFRLDSSSSDFVLRRCDLDSVIRNCIHKFAPQFVRKRIRLEYEPTNRQVLTDEKWLSLIVEQLLSNAIKYTDSGQITIAVSEDDLLSITDTGIGIAPEDLPRIFERGFTGYNGRAGKKSTGLGLYLSKKAADKLSCRLWATSTVGTGSTFYLDLHQPPLEPE